MRSLLLLLLLRAERLALLLRLLLGMRAQGWWLVHKRRGVARGRARRRERDVGVVRAEGRPGRHVWRGAGLLARVVEWRSSGVGSTRRVGAPARLKGRCGWVGLTACRASDPVRRRETPSRRRRLLLLPLLLPNVAIVGPLDVAPRPRDGPVTECSAHTASGG